jgi:hypothetical protein
MAGMGRKKLKKRILIAGSLIALSVLLMGLVSCGGGSSGSSSSGSSSSGSSSASATPAGTYDLTLVATSNKASYKITLPVTVK